MTPDICRMAREALGWSTARLARAAGLDEKTVIGFETGAKASRPGTLIAIRRALASVTSAEPAG